MINNFESWRKAKQQHFSVPHTLMHYHRVSDVAWGDVANFLMFVLKVRVDTFSQQITFVLSDNLANSMLQFLDEMRFAYIHPRSTSARYDFLFEGKNLPVPTT